MPCLNLYILKALEDSHSNLETTFEAETYTTPSHFLTLPLKVSVKNTQAWLQIIQHSNWHYNMLEQIGERKCFAIHKASETAKVCATVKAMSNLS